MALTFNRIHFKNYLDYVRWGEDMVDNHLNEHRMNMYNLYYNKNAVPKGWSDMEVKDRIRFYGTDSLEELRSEITRYKWLDQLEETKLKMEAKLDELEIQIQHERPRMEWNSQGRGVFVYDKAAISLQRVFKYYDAETDEEVDSDYVETFFGGTDKEYSINTLTNRKVVRKFVTLPNGLPKVRSQIRDVYFMRETTTYIEKKIDLYILVGANANIDSIDQFIYNGMAAIILADRLEQQGVKVRVFGINAVDFMDGSPICLSDWLIKEYGEAVDMNAIALASSDPRVFRWKMLSYYPAISQKFDTRIDEGYGRTPYDAKPHILNFYRSEYIKELKRLDDYNPNKVALYNAKFILGFNFSEGESIREYESTVKMLNKVFNEFKVKKAA